MNYIQYTFKFLYNARRSNTYGVGADDANFGITFEPFPLAGVHVISAVRFQSPAHQVNMKLFGKS